VSALSDFIAAHMPRDWKPTDLIEAVRDTMDRTTVYRYLGGKHPARPSDIHLQAFARVLNVQIQDVRAAAGLARGESTLWEPPPEVHRLTDAQRAALDDFIRASVAALDAAQARDADDQVSEYVARLRATGEPSLADQLQAKLSGAKAQRKPCSDRS